MKIEKDKPLPDHTKRRYEECYAKVILEHFFNEMFSNLVIYDKPDIIDMNNDIGIEVTDCTDQRHKEAVKLWYTMPFVPKEKLQRNKERMKQLGVEYMGGIQSWPIICYDNGIESSVFDSFYDALRNKLVKLNIPNLYKPCKEYHLFVCSEMWVHENWKSSFVKEIKDISSLYERKYDKVYFLTQDELLYMDIKTMNIISFNINDCQYILAVKAREMVEEGEIDEQV